MKSSTWDRLDEESSTFPIMRAGEGAADVEIADAGSEIGCEFHDDYAAFLRRYGGPMVGSLPVFGLRPTKVMGERWSVVEVTRWFRAEGWPETSSWYVISEDGFGNPIGVARDGQVMISDHDVGQTRVLARSFEDVLLQRCFKNP